jgi:hypothetical protein
VCTGYRSGEENAAVAPSADAAPACIYTIHTSFLVDAMLILPFRVAAGGLRSNDVISILSRLHTGVARESIAHPVVNESPL